MWSKRPAAIEYTGITADTTTTTWYVRSGHHGPGRYHLHAAQPTLRRLSLVCRMLCSFAQSTRALSHQKRARPPTIQKRHFFVLIHPSTHAVWVRQRPTRGLLGGMMELPSSLWQVDLLSKEQLLAQTPHPQLRWHQEPALVIKHSFTHFKLMMDFWWAQGEPQKKNKGNGLNWKNEPHTRGPRC